MSNCGFINIKPALTFRPMSPFLAMLIENACRRLEHPELAPTSLSRPVDPAPETAAATVRLDRTV